MRTVRRDTAEPGMESLTNCQANMIGAGIRMIKRRKNASIMKPLTP